MSDTIPTTFHTLYIYPVPQNMLTYDTEKDLIIWSFPEPQFWRAENLRKQDHLFTPELSVTLPTVDYDDGFNPSGENIIHMHDAEGKPLMTQWDNKRVASVAIRLDPVFKYTVSLPYEGPASKRVTYQTSQMRGINIAASYNRWFNQFWEETH